MMEISFIILLHLTKKLKFRHKVLRYLPYSIKQRVAILATLCLISSESRLNHYPRTCPFPWIKYLLEVNAFNPIGPRACNFCVLMPISAPKPNSKPSVNLVDALWYTAAASTRVKKLVAFSLFSVIIASECFVPYLLICVIASLTFETIFILTVKDKYSVYQSSSDACFAWGNA